MQRCRHTPTALVLALALACGAVAERRALQDAPVAAAASGVKPRWDLDLIEDKGNFDLPFGWHDAQCQGAANDYCRYVGEWPSTYWSCALAGSAEQVTPKGTYTPEMMPPEGVPCNLNAKPRQDYNSIRDKGYGDMPNGWYDAQCQGAANDYCRYVGNKPDEWWSCALAGSSEQLSPRGMFAQHTMAPNVPCKGAPIQLRVDVSKLTWPGTDGGWFDISMQGAANDYCRTVPAEAAGAAAGQTEPFWSCAMAGIDGEVTPPGMVQKPPTPEDAAAAATPIRGFVSGVEPEFNGIRYQTDYTGPTTIDASQSAVNRRQCCRVCAGTKWCSFFVYSVDASGKVTCLLKRITPNAGFVPSAGVDLGTSAQCAHEYTMWAQ